MKALRDQISSLSRKVELLLTDFQKLEAQKVELTEANNKLELKIEEKNNTINALEDKVTWLRLNGGDGISENEQKEINSKINRYIKEIDKCIGMLQ